MKKQRLIQLLIVLCLVFALIPVTAFAAEATWVANGDGTWSWMQENGDLVKNQVVQLGDSYYGFDYNGILHEDEEFYWNGGWYRAKAGGVLYSNEWYQPDPESNPNCWYFYTEGGKAAEGLHDLGNGKYRYFWSDGEMLYDRTYYTWNDFTSKNEIFYFDVNGDGVVLNEGWNLLANGKWAYIKEGDLLESGVYEINGAKYYFDWDGFMANNQEFYYNGWRRAKDGGALYENEWYAEYDDEGKVTWYYYIEGGTAASGVTMVGDVPYYFWYDGEMATDYMCSIYYEDHREHYYFGSSGAGVLLANNAWFQTEDGKWMYVKDNELCEDCAVNIGGVIYLFNNDGYLMEDNETDRLRDFDDENGSYYYYRAKSGGVAYVNEWVQPNLGLSDNYYRTAWYYYGEGGRAARGYTVLGSAPYYFWDDGEMACDQVVTNYQYDEDGNEIRMYYYCDANGYATKLEGEGWHLTSDGKWAYVKDGELLRGCIANIDGTNYMFNYEGTLAEKNETTGMTNAETGVYEYYRCKGDGLLYENEWCQPYKDDEDYSESYRNRWYYYGAGGVAASGYTNVGGTYYCFDSNGRMITDTTYYENVGDYTEYYYCAENGVATHLANNTWTLVDEGWAYVKDHELCDYGAYEINGTWYGFNYKGIMYENEAFYADGDEYRAKEGGALYVNEWYRSSSTSRWQYYGNGGRMYEYGVYDIGGTLYAFENGWLAANDIVFGYEPEVGEVAYMVYADGTAAQLTAAGWYQHPEYKEQWIYIQADGTVFVDGLLDLNGTKYVFDGYWMMTNGAASVYDDETDTATWYMASESGAVVTTPGWYIFNGRYYYIQADGTLAYGVVGINGTTYGMTPSMRFNDLFRHEDKLYLAGASGATVEVTADGLYQLPSGYISGEYYESSAYYVENGKLVIDDYRTAANGKTYYFGEIGTALTQVTKLKDGKYYHFGNDGAMVTNGWYDDYGQKFYANADGSLATGLTTIDGVEYYFSSMGTLRYNQVAYYNGYYYALDEAGKVCLKVKEGDRSMNGWHQVGNDWYYVQNGYIASWQRVTIDGVEYFFEDNGKMTRNRIRSGKYYGADGTTQSGWIYEDGVYYYADPATKQLKDYGLYTINGTEYFFENYVMQTGTFIDYNSQTILAIASSGAVQSKTPITNGWYYTDDGCFYYLNGEAQHGWIGNYYIEDGRMRTYAFVWLEDDEAAFVQKDGQRLYGWYQYIDGDFICADENGVLYQDEWVTMGGKTYYFNYIWMACGGIYEIDGHYYEFADDGTYLGEVYLEDEGVPDGWFSDNNGRTWYYGHAGYVVTDEIKYIDGNYYAFYSSGRMVADDFYDNYYFDENGIRQNYVGWQQIWGDWWYFDNDYTTAQGWVGNYYISDGLMQTGYATINGKLYNFGTDGVCQGEVKLQNGWYQGNGQWYFFENGELVIDSVLYVGNTLYAFDYDGTLCGEGIWQLRFGTSDYDYDYNYYYVNADGTVRTTQGWYEVSGLKNYVGYIRSGWIYVGENGQLYNGYRLVDGVPYTFLYGMML